MGASRKDVVVGPCPDGQAEVWLVEERQHYREQCLLLKVT